MCLCVIVLLFYRETLASSSGNEFLRQKQKEDERKFHKKLKEGKTRRWWWSLIITEKEREKRENWQMTHLYLFFFECWLCHSCNQSSISLSLFVKCIPSSSSWVKSQGTIFYIEESFCHFLPLMCSFISLNVLIIPLTAQFITKAER